MTNTEFLKMILNELLEKKEDIKINEVKDELGVLVEVEVNKSDMPVLIGKKGTTIKAIKDIVRVHGGVNNERVNVKIIENN